MPPARALKARSWPGSPACAPTGPAHRPPARSITQPKPEVLRGCPGGGRAYLSLDAPGLALVATARDPGIFEYTGAMRQSTHEWASGALLQRE